MPCFSRSLTRMRLSSNANFIESCAEGESSSVHATFFRLYTFCVLSLIESLKRPCPRVLMRLNRVYALGSHVYILAVPPSDYERVFLLAFVLYIFALSKLKRGTREDDAIVTAAKSRKAWLVCVSLDMRETPRLFACTAVYINPPQNEFNDTGTTRNYKCLRNAK